MQQSRPNQIETADNAEDNPALSNVLERNIRMIIHLRQNTARERGLQDRIADVITSSNLRHSLKENRAHVGTALDAACCNRSSRQPGPEDLRA